MDRIFVDNFPPHPTGDFENSDGLYQNIIVTPKGHKTQVILIVHHAFLRSLSQKKSTGLRDRVEIFVSLFHKNFYFAHKAV
jgi:hypothetical protein